MTTQHVLLYNWYWDPLAIALCALALAVPLWNGFRTRAALGRGRTGFFWLGFAVLVIALLSPIATLARSYLFSAHMAQHLLLLLVVPPLFLLGAVNCRSRRKEALTFAATATGDSAPKPPHMGSYRPKLVSAGGAMSRFERSRAFIPLAWLAGVGSMWLWHVPTLCNAATSSPALYHFQIVSLLGLGALFWWPIVGPHALQQLSPLAGIAYLVTACFACTVLGIYVTFAPVSVCSIYVHPSDSLGLLPLIQNHWGLTPETDQQIGGLLMWVPACLIYLSGVLGLLGRWYTAGEADLALGTSLSQAQRP